MNCPAVLSAPIIRPMPVDHPQGQKAIRMVRAGTSESSAVSNSNGLPDEQPFSASAVQIQRIVRGIATRKRVAKVLDKQRKNREKKKKIRQHRTRRKKGRRRTEIATKTSNLVLELELMAAWET